MSEDAILSSIEELSLDWVELKNNSDELIGDVEIECLFS